MDVSLLIARVNIAMMKGVLSFFIVFLLIFGALFLFSPAAIARLNKWGNKVIFQPRDNVDRSSLMGILLITLGIIMLAILLVIKAKTGA